MKTSDFKIGDIVTIKKEYLYTQIAENIGVLSSFLPDDWCYVVWFSSKEQYPCSMHILKKVSE